MDTQVQKIPIERQREIALILLKKQIKTTSVSLNKKEIDRKIGQSAAMLKESGVKKEEIRSMLEEIIREAVDEAFATETPESRLGFKNPLKG
ncbi:MAG: hypothetical protein ACOYMB_05440 [Patescibacteria group bacterium]